MKGASQVMRIAVLLVVALFSANISWADDLRTRLQCADTFLLLSDFAEPGLSIVPTDLENEQNLFFVGIGNIPGDRTERPIFDATRGVTEDECRAISLRLIELPAAQIGRARNSFTPA